MSILRELFVKLGLDTDAESFAKGQLAADGIKEVLEKVVDVAKEVGETFIENVRQTAEFSEQMNQMAGMTGIGVEALQRFSNAARVHGVDTGSMAMTMRRLSEMMYMATEGSTQEAEAARKLGINLNGTLSQALDAISEKFHGMTNAQEKTALATLALGRASPALIDFLSRGKSALEEFTDIPVLTKEQTEAGERAQEQQAALALQTTALWQQAIAPMMPSISSLLKMLYQWKQANAALIEQGLGAVIKGMILAARGLGQAFKVVADAITFFRENWLLFAPLLVGSLAAIAAENAAVAASFVATQGAALAAAAMSAAAWAAAAAPFVAIGAIIEGIYLLFNDISTYEESIKRGGTGAHTILGTLKAGLAKIGEPKAGEPWWLTSLRKAYRIMLDMQALYDTWTRESFGEWLLGTKTAKAKFTPEAQARIDRYENSEAYQRSRAPWYERAWNSTKGAANAIYNTPVVGTALDTAWTLSKPTREVAKWSSGLTPAMAAYDWMRGDHTTNNTTVNVHPSPGMDERALAEHTVRVMREHGVVTGSDLQHAHGAAPATAGGGL